MNKTKIEWTELTWNPITGCSKVSDGCTNCYAERMAKRLKAMKNPRYKNGFNVTIHRDLFEKPLMIEKPKLIFVNSMSDLFHEEIPKEVIIELFSVMNQAKKHTFQILTKRAERLEELGEALNWTPNIWIGVSVENRKTLQRVDKLRDIEASIKFVSFEPLLEDLGEINLDKIDWAVVGGESGPSARRMEENWVRSIQTQCQVQGVRFFFKQWGGTRKKVNGRLLDGTEHLNMPEIKTASY